MFLWGLSGATVHTACCPVNKTSFILLIQRCRFIDIIYKAKYQALNVCKFSRVIPPLRSVTFLWDFFFTHTTLTTVTASMMTNTIIDAVTAVMMLFFTELLN